MFFGLRHYTCSVAQGSYRRNEVRYVSPKGSRSGSEREHARLKGGRRGRKEGSIIHWIERTIEIHRIGYSPD
jgi:hypothetical protein